MAVIALPTRAHERGPAHSLERRSPLEGVSSSSVATPSTVPQLNPASETVPNFPPHTVKALAAVIVIFGLIILGFVAWRLIVWKRRKQVPLGLSGKFSLEKGNQNLDIEKYAPEMEKPREVVLVPPTPTPGTGWVPQIRSTGPTVIPTPEPIQKKSSLRSKSKWDNLNLSRYSQPPAYKASSNPPSLKISAPSPIPPPPPPPTQTTFRVQPPTPPASLKLKSIPSESVPPAVPSPLRSASFLQGFAPNTSDKKLPRLMTVATTFDPSLEDELLVRLGETVRLLEEYEDEWCLVQRIGKDGPKGVIPRFCLEERSDISSQIRTGRISTLR